MHPLARLLARLALLAVFVVSLFGALVHAQPLDAGPALDVVAGIPVEAEPSFTELASYAMKVATDWRSLGALAGVAALIALLVQIMKMARMRKLIDDTGHAWARPAIALVLAGAGGALTALQSGAGVGPSIIAGVLAGLTGLGGRELLANVLSPTERARVKVDVAAVSQASTALRAQIEADAEERGHAAVLAAQVQLDAIDKLHERERLEKLALMLAAPKKPELVRTA